jgi:hypothetical protein
MAKSSLQLIAECQRRGLISKEATVSLLRERDQIIKQAMRVKSAAMFGGLLSKGKKVTEAVAPKMGLLDKLKVGGLTGKSKDGVAAGSAQWNDVAANLGKMMALAGLTAGASAGIGGIMRHSKDKKLRKEIDLSYKKMFVEHPGLKDIEEEDPGRVRRHFGVLARYAPSLAADPTVAGTWVQSTAQVGQINQGDIKNLAETQNKIDDVREERGGIQLSPLSITDFAHRAMSGGG